MYTNTRLIIWRFLWIIPFILMTGCSSTKVLNTWQPENLEVKHIDKALIVGVAADDINRRLFEDSFASALNEKGAKAYTSYDIVSSDNKNQIEQFRNAAKQLGADSILVTHLVGTKTKEQYNPADHPFRPVSILFKLWQILSNCPRLCSYSRLLFNP